MRPTRFICAGLERPPRDRRDHLLSRGSDGTLRSGHGAWAASGARSGVAACGRVYPPHKICPAGRGHLRRNGDRAVPRRNRLFPCTRRRRTEPAPAENAPRRAARPVRTAILRAAEEGRTVREEGLRIKSEGRSVELALEVIPIKSGAGEDGGFLVLFDEGARRRIARRRQRETLTRAAMSLPGAARTRCDPGVFAVGHRAAGGGK